MASPVKITAILTARAGKAAELAALLDRMVPHCRAEPGNLRWDVWQDQAEDGRFVLDELYRDDAAVEEHRETPHYKDYRDRVPELAERTAFVLRPKHVLPDGR
ncbi:putative quinol monooxygenase [Azospirillum himalayense]|uniref:Quinol monooxygenase n=1 Tax=Azospirillum himalayense TaxID=654847 RepID=A0ABW0G8N5_9PROT